jgi:hypothetical protein
MSLAEAPDELSEYVHEGRDRGNIEAAAFQPSNVSDGLLRYAEVAQDASCRLEQRFACGG